MTGNTNSSSGGATSAIVMGGSLGGMHAAIALRQQGLDVTVFERSKVPLEGRGAGIVLHPVTVRPVDDRLDHLTAHAVAVRYIGDGGAVLHDEPCSYRFSSYFALHRELLGVFDRERYHLGRHVASFEQDDDGVAVCLEDGSTARADLLVCADGIHSASRKGLLPEVQPRYAGYVGWRGTAPESALTPETYEKLADAISYCVVPNSHILIYPIPNFDGCVDPGRRLMNFVWYLNVDEGDELDNLLTNREGQRMPISLGAGAVPDATVEELRTIARDILPAPVAEVVVKSPQPFVQAVYDIAVPHMAFGRAALIGDAAFALRPHVAAGTAKAAEDAWTLAAAVGESPDDVPGALQRWEGPQLELGRSVVARAREVGIKSQFENSWRVGDPLPFGLHESGDSLLP